MYWSSLSDKTWYILMTDIFQSKILVRMAFNSEVLLNILEGAGYAERRSQQDEERSLEKHAGWTGSVVVGSNL